ncbi:unnamed protein product [Symbiodinium natans]|uniref:Uncharacterized protein n=1 Tax=Symbiodinium natans TaxID=878477 RepID=A0A812QPS0_9DINO|nr:unnamed protein product [Symbiodinium natans]
MRAAEPVAEGRPGDRARPCFDELRQMRPLIIHLGTHYFLLDSVDELPASLSLEEGSIASSRSFLDKCGRCFFRCLDRWSTSRSFSSEARAPLRQQ